MPKVWPAESTKRVSDSCSWPCLDPSQGTRGRAGRPAPSSTGTQDSRSHLLCGPDPPQDGKGLSQLWVPSHSPCRMKALSILLLPALGLLVCGETLCPVDEAINAKIGTGITSLSKDLHIQPEHS